MGPVSQFLFQLFEMVQEVDHPFRPFFETRTYQPEPFASQSIVSLDDNSNNDAAASSHSALGAMVGQPVHFYVIAMEQSALVWVGCDHNFSLDSLAMSIGGRVI